MGAFESGSSFLTGALAKLSPEQQAQVKAVLDAPEARDLLITIGDGVLARSDYSKHMDDLKAKESDLQSKYDELTGWYEKNEAAVKEYVQIKPEYERLKGAGPTPTPSPTPTPTPTPDFRTTAREVMTELGQDYLQVSAWLAAKTATHMSLFQEPLDAMALINHPKLGKPVPGQSGRVFSLNDVYQESFGERLAQKAKATEDARITQLVEARLVEERSKGGPSLPFPLRPDASVLDTLATKPDPSQYSVDAAVAEYARLTAAKQ